MASRGRMVSLILGKPWREKYVIQYARNNIKAEAWQQLNAHTISLCITLNTVQSEPLCQTSMCTLNANCMLMVERGRKVGGKFIDDI